MGLGKAKDFKKMLKVRVPKGWVSRGELKDDEGIRDDVLMIVLDFLLDMHQFAFNPELTYEMLMKKVQQVVLNNIRIYPNVQTLVLLLDEQRYVPLGKVPTQTNRKKPLTAKERKDILDGGVISSMDPSIAETIEEKYEKESSVRNGKRTAFSIFFERYIRTRELRKDLVVFITKCLSQLIQSRALPPSLRIYIDGMKVSTYFAPPDQLFTDTVDEDGTPLVKRRRSVSGHETVNCFEHEDEKHLSVCRLAWSKKNDSISWPLGTFHGVDNTPTVDEERREEMEVKPRWLRKEDGDADIFMGHKGTHERQSMGESDIKAAYYPRRMAEALANAVRHSDTELDTCACLVISSDTDLIPILLLTSSEYPESTKSKMKVLLDTKPKGGSSREILSLIDSDPSAIPITVSHSKDGFLEISAEDESGVFNHLLGRVVYPRENEFLTEIIKIPEMPTHICRYFEDLHPGVPNPVETLCLLMMLGGSDYVDSQAGIGFAYLVNTFDLGGYMFLSQAISIKATTVSSGMRKRHRNGRFFSDVKTLAVQINEDFIKKFYNLTYRYAHKMNGFQGLIKTISNAKSVKSKKIKDLEKKITAIRESAEELSEDVEDRRRGRKNLNISDSDYEDIMEAEKKKEEIILERDFLNNFLPKEMYLEMSKHYESNGKTRSCMIRFFMEKMDLSLDECDVWASIEEASKKKRKELILKRKKKILTQYKGRPPTSDMTDEAIAALLNRGIHTLKDHHDIDASIRRIAWNIAYWTLSPYVCMRETKHMNSLCRIDVSEHDETIARANRHQRYKETGGNQRIDKFFGVGDGDSSIQRTSPPHLGGKRKLSLNGFSRVYKISSNDRNSSRAHSDAGSKATKTTKTTKATEDSSGQKKQDSEDRDRSVKKRRRNKSIVPSKTVFPSSRITVDLVC